MPPRNLNIIILAFIVSGFCYLADSRTKTALHVGDALNLINNYYVDPVDEDELLTAAMNGMISTLDQHSEYIPVQQFETFQDNINQEFAGIGIFVEQPEQGQPVRVITPLVGSPALSAGILPGDQFIRIDDQDVSSLGLQEVSTRLKGPVGTTVKVTVRRGDQEVDLRIQRATIELESVIGDYRDDQNQWVYRLRDDPSIAYIRLTGFGEKTVEELRQVLVDLDNDFAALIFDLRGNGGGLLDTAIEVSDMFLDEGEIVSTQNAWWSVGKPILCQAGNLGASQQTTGDFDRWRFRQRQRNRRRLFAGQPARLDRWHSQLRQGNRPECLAAAVRSQRVAADRGSLLSSQRTEFASR